MASLKERLENGDRWFLALVDPVLERPWYLALKKETITVGFLPDCDWVLPWKSMGLDVIADSRRLDERYCPEIHKVHGSWPKQPPIGERENEPFFNLEFDPTLIEGRCWTAWCPAEHDCNVRLVRCSGWQQAWMGQYNGSIANDGWQLPGGLADGTVFEFFWPHHAYWTDEDQYCCVHKLFPQKLRFVFIEERAGVKGLMMDKEKPQQSLTLADLPVKVLARIASFLEPKEFLPSMALVSRVFTSTAMKEEGIPWRHLTLDNSFDALRIPVLAQPEAVQEIECCKLWDKETRDGVFEKWKPLVHGGNVKRLKVHDPQFLCVVGVPCALEELELIIEDEFAEWWQKLESLHFPSSIKKLKINRIKSCLDVDRDAFSDYYRFVDKNEGMDRVWLFTSFREVEQLWLSRIPFLRRRKHDDDARLADNFFNSVTHLCLDGVVADAVPFWRMKNLAVFKALFPSFAHLDYTPDPADPWTQLESVTLGFDFQYSESWFREVLEFMPRMRFLRIMKPTIESKVLDSILAYTPQLRVLWIKKASLNLISLARLLRRHPMMDVLTVVEAEGSVGRVKRTSFPQGENVTVRWESWFEYRGGYPKFTFFFSRIPDAEYEELRKKHLHAPFEE